MDAVQARSTELADDDFAAALGRNYDSVIDMLRANRDYWFARNDLVMVRSLDEDLVDAGADPADRKTCGGCGTWAHPGKPSPVIDCRPGTSRRWATGLYLT